MAHVETVPQGPGTQCLRTLDPKTIPLMVFGTKGLKWLFSKIRGPMFESAQKNDYGTWGSLLGSLFFGKPPNIGYLVPPGVSVLRLFWDAMGFQLRATEVGASDTQEPASQLLVATVDCTPT